MGNVEEKGEPIADRMLRGATIDDDTIRAIRSRGRVPVPYVLIAGGTGILISTENLFRGCTWRVPSLLDLGNIYLMTKQYIECDLSTIY